MNKVAIYSRKSIFTGKGESVENQVEMCKDYYFKHFNKNVEFIIYEDEGFSGGNINRPKFKEMINDIKAKKFNTLICYRLDRISRNVADFSNTLELLQYNKIDFISIKEQFDTTTPMGRAMVYISSVFAQLERETIAERVRDNMIQLAKTGRWLGGQEPYGFKSEKTTYIDENYNEKSLMKLSPLHDEIQVVKLIYDKYLETNSITQVTNYLQDNRYKGKNNGEWQTQQVIRILSSPMYVKSDEKTHNYLKSLGCNVYGDYNGNGYLSYNKTEKIRIERDISEWMYTVSKHKGIIDSDIWLKVQQILDRNKDKKIKRLGTGKNKGLLTGILKCSKCGSNMIIANGGKKPNSDERRIYYVCSAKRNSRRNKCDAKNVEVNKLDKIVIDELSSYSKDYLLQTLEALEKEVNKSAYAKIPDTSKIESEIEAKELQISNLVKQLSSSPSETVTDYIMKGIDKISKEINELKLSVKNINNNKKEFNSDLENLKITINLLENFSTVFNITDDIHQKRLLLQTILKEVIWDGDNLEAKLIILEDKKK